MCYPFHKKNLPPHLSFARYTIRRFLTNKVHDPLKYRTEFLNEDLEDRDFDDVIDDVDMHEPPDDYKDSCSLSIPLSSMKGSDKKKLGLLIPEDAESQLRKELGLDEVMDRDLNDRFAIKPKKKRHNMEV
jgi:hypothetical protein